MRFALSTGLLCLVTTCPALADYGYVPTRSMVPRTAQVAVYNWSGLYVGGHGGHSWSREKLSSTVATTIPPALPVVLTPGTQVDEFHGGFLAGGQFGANLQIHNLVLGVEAQGSWSNESGSLTTPAVLGGTSMRLTADTRAYLTAAVRAGWAVNEWLVYIKGGGAWKWIDYTAAALVGGAVTGTSGFDDVAKGWMVGGGIEVGIDRNWSVKIEYNYLDFGTDRPSVAITGAAPLLAAFDLRRQTYIVMAGLNYRFTWGPERRPAVVARY